MRRSQLEKGEYVLVIGAESIELGIMQTAKQKEITIFKGMGKF
ncbi:hypothetical protein [Gracilibacillus phocaeensis]|nr:hypothetical protein [Gracilibacillus phocaeensis]